jgi:meso-butanediol dehydrogenase / (S,S)-butanediol dehydrogenase / diacetyl reductase
MTSPLAVITGAGSGIGAAIATTLAQRGHEVVVTDVDFAAAERVVDTIPGATAIALDVTDPYRCSEVVDEVVARFGRLDVWVSNAGVSKMQRFVDVSPGDLARTFEVNTYGVFYCGQAAARAMIKLATPGVIINTASMAAKQGGVPFLSDYVASKFAVLGLTQAMAYELAAHGIRVNCVCPGFVATSMQSREIAWEADLRDMDADAVTASYVSGTPMSRLETPDDVARVVAFLVSDDAAFVTGESISVNGGAFMD